MDRFAIGLDETLRDEFLLIIERTAYDELEWNETHRNDNLYIKSQRKRLAIMWAGAQLGLIDKEAIHKPASVLGEQAVMEARARRPRYRPRSRLSPKASGILSQSQEG